MLRVKKTIAMSIAAVAAASFALSASAVELTTNGDFETGTYASWAQFPTGPNQSITTINPSPLGGPSVFASEVFNTTPASNSLIKQANIGIGTVTPFQSVLIQFDARGSTADGGVAFAEFFSEIAGGGTSSSVILGGAPLALDANPNVWKHFSFTTSTGANVSGGVTLQLGAVTGAAPTSVAHLWWDNASVSVVPVPAAVWLFGSALGLMGGLRRRMS